MRLLLAASVVIGCLLASGVASGATGLRVQFTHLPTGWQAADDYALSWRARASEAGWAAGMPRGGIAVTVIVLPRRVGYPPLRLMLPGRAAGSLEAVRDTREYRIFGRFRSSDVEIRIAIRRVNPTRRQLERAQRVVSGIRLVPSR